MLIFSEFDIQFSLPAPSAVVALLRLHPSLDPQLCSAEKLLIEHKDSFAPSEQPMSALPIVDYVDSFGNRCSRFLAPAGYLRLSGSSTIEIDGTPDKIYSHARQMPIDELPSEVLQFLLPSRYCEVDRFGAIANDLFSSIPAGWERATYIRDWVHERVKFNYNAARPTKTAMDVFTERTGVCRDFQHLAVTLSRCQNIPARYVTGYIGDIHMPYSGPGDFSAWYQVFLDGQWIDLDARHNYPRLGRILMATGRDAADVAITTSFGATNLASFYVDSWEVDADGNRVVAPVPEPMVPLRTYLRELTAPTQSNGEQASPTQTQAATT
jgi:transglutaminase-like putative cysteine protease